MKCQALFSMKSKKKNLTILGIYPHAFGRKGYCDIPRLSICNVTLLLLDYLS